MLQAASPRSHLASSRCIPSTLQPQILLDRKGLLALAAHPPAPRGQSVSVSNASAPGRKSRFWLGHKRVQRKAAAGEAGGSKDHAGRWLKRVRGESGK